MTYAILPLTNDPRQVFTAGVMPDGAPFRAQVSVRRIPAAWGRRRSPPGGRGGGGHKKKESGRFPSGGRGWRPTSGIIGYHMSL